MDKEENKGCMSSIGWICSIIGIFLSIISIISSCRFNNIQNEKWEKLNEPDIILKEIKVLAFKEMDTESVLKQAWAYDVKCLSVIKDETVLDRCRIYSSLVFCDSDSKCNIMGRPMFTVEDVEKEAKRLNIQNRIIRKRMKLNFKFYNKGKLLAKKVRIRLEVLNSDIKDQIGEEISTEAAGEMDLYYPLNLYFSPDKAFPKELNINFYIDYEFNNKKYPTKKIPVKYYIDKLSGVIFSDK